jgi:phenylacetate-CoA ligase
LSRSSTVCACKRGFPVIDQIYGRQTDVVVTPDGRAITALYVILDRTPGLELGQIVQEKIDEVTVRVACEHGNRDSVREALIRNTRDFLGDSVKISVVFGTYREILGSEGKKFKVVVSKIHAPAGV